MAQILSSIFSIFLILYKSFLTISFFTTSLNLLNLTGTGNYLSASNLSTLLLKLLKLVGRFFNLPTCNLFTLEFKLAKSTFLAKDDVSIPVVFLKICFCRIIRQM